MAKTTRDKLKRKLAQAYRNIDNSLADLKIVHDTFKDVHPDLADGLASAIQLEILAQETIILFADKCWYVDKETLMKYL